MNRLCVFNLLLLVLTANGFTAFAFQNSRRSLATELSAALKEDGASAARKKFLQLKNDSRFELSEQELNTAGYQFLGRGENAAATVLFQIATEAFPNSPNVWDSLGEAHLAGGKKVQAIAAYQKALRLNPNNGAARALVWRLKQETTQPSLQATTSRTINVAKTQSAIDQAVSKAMKEHNIVGAAVVVVQKGRTVLKRGYGLALLNGGSKVDPDKTIFRIGSISKALTFLTLSRLVDQGKIAMHDNVEEYFGPIPNPRGLTKPITIENLMTHTTGLDQIGVGRQIRSFDQTIDQRMAMRSSIGDFLKQNNLRRVSEPGQSYRYDTYGSTLGGFIVSKVVGKSYRDAMKSEMFEPLGMTRTAVEAEQRLRASLATGYETLNGQNAAQPYEIYLTTPASSIDATPADMGRLLEALTADGANSHGRFLSARMTRAVLAPQFRPHPEFAGTTHGLHESHDVSGDFAIPIRSVDHGGTMAGFRSLMNILPAYDTGVFITCNAGGRHDLFQNVMRAIVGELADPPKREPHAIPKRDPSLQLAEFNGTYAYGVFCHSCTPTEYAQGAWGAGRPTLVRATNGALTIRDRTFLPRGGDVFVRDDGQQMAYFGRNKDGRISFFSYSTSADAFERVDDLP